jgi:hypothetical protein
MKFGKTIKIFLIDGDPNGRMTCEISNWTGKAYKIPRNQLKDCGDRTDLNNTGIYLLFGKNEEGQDQVYIGEAEIILKRLLQHLTQKDFWHEVILFISKDENLNKAHVKYLESRLFETALSVKRYVLDNSVTPTQSSISESDRAEMEEFLDNIKVLVNTLGHKVFEQKRESGIKERNEEIFKIENARGASAFGKPTSEGFLVLKGSKIAASYVKSYQPYMYNLRAKLLENKIVIPNGEFLELVDDYLFGSPSTAAAIVLGRSANGLIEWKLPSGKNLKTYETGDAPIAL